MSAKTMCGVGDLMNIFLFATPTKMDTRETWAIIWLISANELENKMSDLAKRVSSVFLMPVYACFIIVEYGMDRLGLAVVILELVDLHWCLIQEAWLYMQWDFE